jgi:tetratricopeptide (TPR) repeat protein
MTAARPPLCFVVMPFGVKPDGRGGSIDFDAVYENLIAPAVAKAGLQPLRADQELVGGIVHKPMFERLILSDYAVADLTTANANVFYELGVRHAVRPYSTVLIAAGVGGIPFDLAPDRVLPYELDAAGLPVAFDDDAERLTAALRAARQASTDSPVFQLVDDLPTPEIDRAKTDIFRDQAAYSATAKRRLADARASGLDALLAAERELGSLEDVEAGITVDLFLSYRAIKAWDEMIRLAGRMPRPLAQTVMVREQLGFALNRVGRSEEAEEVLLGVLEQRGPSSETYGLLGRVYKDRWAAEREGSRARARGYLRQAIDAYRSGFEADWRDAYPGINAVTLMEILDPGGDEQQRLVPVVRYAAERRVADGRADYWDHATRLELAVIARAAGDAEDAASDALAAVREPWEPESTANNLRLIREARAEAGEQVPWADALEGELLRVASSTAT